jgi:hypothetical protein
MTSWFGIMTEFLISLVLLVFSLGSLPMRVSTQVGSILARKYYSRLEVTDRNEPISILNASLWGSVTM